MKLSDLSEATGVSPRNIKRYIQERLLAPPDGKTRGASYGESHRRLLVQIESLRSAGLSIDEVRAQIADGRFRAEGGGDLNHPPHSKRVQSVVEHRYEIDHGVFLVLAMPAKTKLTATEVARRCKLAFEKCVGSC